MRRRREALGLSQEHFARTLGVSRQSVYMWEAGKTQPPAMLDLALRYLEQEHASNLVDPAELLLKEEHDG